jgi:DNA-binding winged helix-turn-helix (wHTH) protein/Tfp pilus assembly protein PilF
VNHQKLSIREHQVSLTYRFGPFSFDPTRRRLSCDGHSIAVPPKALDVLEVLLENRGRTVEKDNLMGRVWPDTAVEEANLTQSVFMLRRALGDDASDSRYISTVARRGYRFIGAATEAPGAEAFNAPRHVHRTANLEAYHAYLKGRHYWSKRDVDGMRAAIALFRQAIDLDPTYALAYVGLAECFVILRVHCWPSAPDSFVMARAAATKALEIDDTIAEAHATLGMIRMVAEWNWDAAEQAFRRAVELAPDYATTRNWYANWLAAQGRLDDAIREAQEAARLDALNVTWHMGVGHMLFLARRYEESIETELNVLEMDPQFWLAHWFLGMAYEQIGQPASAIAAFRQADDFSAGNLLVRGVLGRILALHGNVSEGRRMLDDLTSRHGRDAAPSEIAGMIHDGLGDIDAAFDCFQRAAREGSYLLSFLNVSPIFDSLRSHERFDALLRLVRLG